MREKFKAGTYRLEENLFKKFKNSVDKKKLTAPDLTRNLIMKYLENDKAKSEI